MRETPTLLTDADSMTNTNLKRLQDFFFLISCVLFHSPQVGENVFYNTIKFMYLFYQIIYLNMLG